MASLAERLMKTTKLDKSSMMDASQFFKKKPTILTDVPIINLALSSHIDEGFGSGLMVLAGPSKHFKSALGLLMCAAYMNTHPESIMIFYDSEFGASSEYFKSAGIDISRVLHIPIKNIEDLKFDIMQKLDEITTEDKVIIFVDSIGNLASKKEVEDALNEKAVADMTRAKQLKGLFRMVTPYLTLNDIPMIAINHVYEEIGAMYAKTIVGGGCLLEDTGIKMADGSVKAIQNIVVGDYVSTLSGPQPVTHVWDEHTLDVGRPECIRVTMNDGYVVECSDTHPFLVSLPDGSRHWVAAAKLRPNQTIVSSRESIKVSSVESIGKHPVFDISVDGTEHYVLENGAVTHNTGIYYSANAIYIIGRRQIKKEGDAAILGWEFVLNVEKSRSVREKCALPFSVTYEGGIDRYSGLLEIARVAGFVVSEKKGWYKRTIIENDKSWRKADTSCPEFWDVLLDNQEFKDKLHQMYQIGSSGPAIEEKMQALIESPEIEDHELES